MATKIIASELINVVRYQTDRNSLNKVRKQMRQLRQQMENDSVKQSKAEIKRMREQADAEIRETKRAAREKAKAENLGSGKRGGKTQAERDAARQAKEQQRQQAKQRREEEKRIREQGTRQERANLMLRRNAFDITRMQGLNQEQRHNAIREVQRISQAYHDQTMSLQASNEALRQQRRQLQAIARESRAANRRAGVPTPAGHSRLASSLALAGLGGGLGYMGERAAGAARETLQGSVERNSGRQQLNSLGISTIEADALIAEARKNGYTLTYEQLADKQKDYNDKAGQLTANGSWKQARDGSWSLSGGGEFGDIVNSVTAKRGKAAGEQVVSNLQGMNFTEFLVYLRQLQKTMGYSEKELTAFAEAIDDGSVALQAVKDGGKNLTDTAMQIARSGQSLTDQQSQNLSYLSNLGSVAQSASENLQDSFSSAFAGRMEELGIGADETRESFAELKPVMQELGREIGSVTAWISKHLGMIPGSASYNRDTYQQSYNSALEHKDDSPFMQWVYKRWNSTSTAGDAGWQDAIAGRAMDQKYVNPYATPESNFATQNPLDQRYANLAMGNPLDFQTPKFEFEIHNETNVNTNDDRLMGVFTAHTQQEILNSWDDMTFQVNNMTSNN
ncbi:TPA: hypothetical protein ACQ8JS_003105 [Klebsiella pneumoniae]